jgi:DNA-directed RNA polymerase specialized sigma subunit
MFNDNIRYYGAMARNIGARFGIKPEFYDTQPTGAYAELLTAGRQAALVAYLDYFKNKPKNIDLKKLMAKRAASAMYHSANNIKSLINPSKIGIRHISKINQYRDKYFNKHGHFPNINEIADNVQLLDYNTGKDYKPEKKIKLIDDILKHAQPMSMLSDTENLVSEDNTEDVITQLPTAEQLMTDIRKIYGKRLINAIEYKIIKLYLGHESEHPMNLSEIGRSLKLDRRSVSVSFNHILKVLKPQFEKYRDLLEKSMDDRVREFIRLVLDTE